MKAKFYYAALATLMLASCSQDDVIQEIDTSQSAIGFTTFVDLSSRSATTTTDNLTTFKVWGTKFREGNADAVRIMDATDVTKSGDNWVYSPPKFWVNENAYSFTAIGSSHPDITKYYTYTAPDVSSIVYDTYLTHYMGKLTYNNGTNGAKGDADLIWSSVKVPTIPANGKGPSAVNLTFGHLLSKVRLLFVNERTGDIVEEDGSVTQINPYVTIKNVSVSSASTAELDFSNFAVGTPSTEFTWTNFGSNFSCPFSFDDSMPVNSGVTLDGGESSLTQDRFLIPNQGSITVSFDCYTDITTLEEASGKINISKTITFGPNGSPDPFKGIDLKPGYSYTLIAYLTDDLDNSGVINFKVEVEEYIDNSEPAYGILFSDVEPIYTYGDAGTLETSSTTLGVSDVTAAAELVYYGRSNSDPSPVSLGTNYAYRNYDFVWSIPANPAFGLYVSNNLNGIDNIYSWNAPVDKYGWPNALRADLYCKGNYSPNGTTEDNDGSIDATLTVYKDGVKLVSKTLSVPVKYRKKHGTTTGGSQDGDDNDG